jgi:ferrous iron transport protein B
MDCHTHPIPVLTEESPVVLVGNPNVGKSVIFGALTRHYVTVSNYPGTTIEVAHGTLPDGTPLIDTPGINSFYSRSDDERVTRDLLIDHLGDIRAVVQIADAKNLQRALLLTEQLAEFGLPLVLVVNMLDEAEAHGVCIDTAELSRRLGIDVIETVATRSLGIDQLQAAIRQARTPASSLTMYDPSLEAALGRVSHLLPDHLLAKRALALQLLGGDAPVAVRFSMNGALTQICDETVALYGRPLRTEILHQQIVGAQRLLDGIVTHSEQVSRSFAQRLSRWTTHPIWGVPILLLVLYIVYKLVGEFGAGTLVDFMEGTVFGEWINPLATQLVDTVLPIPIIHDLLVGEYGVITMALAYGLALILPIVAVFFLSFSILEDTGYLPRLAVMLNRFFRLMGLNGKAVLPMILGLGCDTMATLSTRILETRKERILVTLLLALGIPCSAQLGVILGMMGTLSSSAILIWVGVVVITVLIVGWLAARVMPGERSDFILELPPLRLPRLQNIVIKTLARVEWYLKEVLPLFIVGTLFLFVVDRIGILTTAEQVASPLVVGFLGLPAAATGAFIVGFLRRDYGAAGLFALALSGAMSNNQIVVSMIVITLFIPCIANVMMIFKEYGWRVTAAVTLTVFPLAFAVGGLVNAALNMFGVVL